MILGLLGCRFHTVDDCYSGPNSMRLVSVRYGVSEIWMMPFYDGKRHRHTSGGSTYPLVKTERTQ